MIKKILASLALIAAMCGISTAGLVETQPIRYANTVTYDVVPVVTNPAGGPASPVVTEADTNTFFGDVRGPATNLTLYAIRGLPISTNIVGAGQAYIWDGTNFVPAAILSTLSLNSVSNALHVEILSVSNALDFTILGTSNFLSNLIFATVDQATNDYDTDLIGRLVVLTNTVLDDVQYSSVGGDITGKVGNAVVVALRNYPISTNAVGINQTLVWDGTNFVPSTVLSEITLNSVSNALHIEIVAVSNSIVNGTNTYVRIKTSATNFTDDSDVITRGYLGQVLASRVAVTYYGATNDNPIIPGHGSFFGTPPSYEWTNEYILSVGTNYVGDRYYTQATTFVQGGSYNHVVYIHVAGDYSNVTYRSDLVLSDGTTTNILDEGSVVNPTPVINAQQSTTVTTNQFVPEVGGPWVIGVQRVAILSAGAATLHIYGGPSHLTRLETPLNGSDPAAATQGLASVVFVTNITTIISNALQQALDLAYNSNSTAIATEFTSNMNAIAAVYTSNLVASANASNAVQQSLALAFASNMNALAAVYVSNLVATANASNAVQASLSLAYNSNITAIAAVFTSNMTALAAAYASNITATANASNALNDKIRSSFTTNDTTTITFTPGNQVWANITTWNIPLVAVNATSTWQLTIGVEDCISAGNAANRAAIHKFSISTDVGFTTTNYVGTFLNHGNGFGGALTNTFAAHYSMTNYTGTSVRIIMDGVTLGNNAMSLQSRNHLFIFRERF